MDDVRIDEEMTLDNIAKRLDEIGAQIGSIRSDISSVREDITSIRSDVTSVRSDVTSVRSDVTSGRSDVTSLRSDIRSLRTKVDSLEHTMKIEFEETRRVVNLGFENVEIVDEKISRRLDATDQKHDDELGLLKDVLHQVTIVARPA